MDHDENRGRLLNDGMLKTILTVLNGYASKGSDMLKQQPLSLSDDELKTIRTAVGVILNATIGFGTSMFYRSSFVSYFFL
jgi:hypothetical protein